MACYFQRAGILYTNVFMWLPSKTQTEVIFNIAEQCHVQYLVEACKNSEDGFDQHGLDLGENLAMCTEKETAWSEITLQQMEFCFTKIKAL